MAKRQKQKLKIKCYTFDERAISEALKISVDAVKSEFKDGRVASRFSEHWGAKLYSYSKHADTNAPGSDGAFDAGELGGIDISVKCLTGAGVKFQKSKYVGSGRSCTQDNLISSLGESSKVIVVDILDFPNIKFIPDDCKALLFCAKKKTLRPNGWKKKQLYEWLNEQYEVTEEVVKL